MRDEIIAEIKRIAATTGTAPGVRVFERETGIRQSAWLGRYWARWSDALREAGLEANEMQSRMSRDKLLEKITEAVWKHKRVPTRPEFRMYSRSDPTFPASNTISNHFPTKHEMIEAVRAWASDKPEYGDVAAMLPAPVPSTPSAINATTKPAEGHVYLVFSPRE